jgi:hypothetical protein
MLFRRGMKSRVSWSSEEMRRGCRLKGHKATIDVQPCDLAHEPRHLDLVFTLFRDGVLETADVAPIFYQIFMVMLSWLDFL